MKTTQPTDERFVTFHLREDTQKTEEAEYVLRNKSFIRGRLPQKDLNY